MKQIFLSLFLAGSFGLLTGCCTDDICGSNAMFDVPVYSPCNSCASACQTCGNSCGTCGSSVGYSSYTYGGWY